MAQLNWSKWCSFRTLDFSIVPASSGVYQIRWAINGKPQLIHRANGNDESGILYIGQSNILNERIKSFWRRIQGQGRHTAGRTYVFYDFWKKFKPEQLEVRWLEHPESPALESELLMEYVEKYLDKPPLNISVPRY